MKQLPGETKEQFIQLLLWVSSDRSDPIPIWAENLCWEERADQYDELARGETSTMLKAAAQMEARKLLVQVMSTPEAISAFEPDKVIKLIEYANKLPKPKAKAYDYSRITEEEHRELIRILQKLGVNEDDY